MSTASYDVIVVGGGIVGCSIAYHLAEQARVLVLERAAIAEQPAASWASAGGVRRQGRHAAEALLAQQAIERWPTLGEELGADLHYRQGGQLLFAESEAEVEQLQAFVALQHRHGFHDVRLADRAECRALAPHVSERVLAASYSPADGQADPPHTTRAFAEAARRRGATIQTGARVQALATNADRVSGVHTAGGFVGAAQVVVAAGAWSMPLLETLGLRFAAQPAAYQMLLSSPAEPGLLCQVIGSLGRALSLKQRDDGAFLLGGGWPGDVSAGGDSYAMRDESVAGNWQTASELFPALAACTIASSWCGIEAESADAIPFIGPAGPQGLYVAFGFSGHGFAIAPEVGRQVAAELLGRLSPALAGLRPERAL
jgi:sarcosine oxidase subunit beta